MHYSYIFFAVVYWCVYEYGVIMQFFYARFVSVLMKIGNAVKSSYSLLDISQW